jgi:hypothetical protein
MLSLLQAWPSVVSPPEGSVPPVEASLVLVPDVVVPESDVVSSLGPVHSGLSWRQLTSNAMPTTSFGRVSTPTSSLPMLGESNTGREVFHHDATPVQRVNVGTGGIARERLARSASRMRASMRDQVASHEVRATNASPASRRGVGSSAKAASHAATNPSASSAIRARPSAP